MEWLNATFALLQAIMTFYYNRGQYLTASTYFITAAQVCGTDRCPPIYTMHNENAHSYSCIFWCDLPMYEHDRLPYVHLLHTSCCTLLDYELCAGLLQFSLCFEVPLKRNGIQYPAVHFDAILVRFGTTNGGIHEALLWSILQLKDSHNIPNTELFHYLQFFQLVESLLKSHAFFFQDYNSVQFKMHFRSNNSGNILHIVFI